MRKIIPIFFIALIGFSQVGYYVFNIIQQHYIKEAVEQQVLAGIPETSLTKIDLMENRSDISWEENGKEFSLRGSMYDVAKVQLINGHAILYCLGDTKEDQLLKNRANAVKSGTDQNNNANQHNNNTVKFQLYDCIVTGTENLYPAQRSTAPEYNDFNSAIISNCNGIITPPPKFYI